MILDEQQGASNWDENGVGRRCWRTFETMVDGDHNYIELLPGIIADTEKKGADHFFGQNIPNSFDKLCAFLCVPDGHQHESCSDLSLKSPQFYWWEEMFTLLEDFQNNMDISCFQEKNAQRKKEPGKATDDKEES
jgi:hypothetical protein